MENQNKGMNNNNGAYEEGNNNNVKMGKKRSIGTCESLLRVLALALTLSAAVILGVDNQTTVVPIKLFDNLPPMNIPVSAKWNYLSASVYFVVTNAIASAYSAISLVLSIANRSGKKMGVLLFVFALDVVMVGLLFSSNGAAAAIGLMGYEGNTHVQWKKVCNVFDKFCHQGSAALAVSLLGAFVFLVLVIIAAKRLHRNQY